MGERIRQIRLARDMTQQQLATAAGMSTRQLGVIENGKNAPQMATLRRIAEALGCDPADLVSPRTDLSADEAEVVAIMRRVPDDRRQILVQQARVFDGAMTVPA